MFEESCMIDGSKSVFIILENYNSSVLITYPVCLPNLPLTELPASYLVGWKLETCSVCHRCQRRRMSKMEGKSAKNGIMFHGEAVSGKNTDSVANNAAKAMLLECCKQKAAL